MTSRNQGTGFLTRLMQIQVRCQGQMSWQPTVLPGRLQSGAAPLLVLWSWAGPGRSLLISPCRLLDFTRKIKFQASVLGHHQPAGEHLWQQGPVHQRIPHAAG